MIATLSTADPETGRPLSRAEQAAALGISRMHLWRLLAAERLGDAEWVPARPAGGREELPYVELAEERRPWLHYRLDDDRLSRLPECPFRIGSGRGRGLQVAHRDDIKGERPKAKKPPPKFKPKRPPKKKDLPI